MAYRGLPVEPVTLGTIPISTEFHILNGSIAEFSFSCHYDVPVEGTDTFASVPADLLADGYKDPTLAIDIVPDGFSWYAWFDVADASVVKVVISAQCPAAVADDLERNISLLLTKTVAGLGDRTEAIVRGPLLIEASPIEGGAATLPEQPTTSASRSGVDTTSFNGVLSSVDTNVQAALETLDDHIHPHTHPVGQLPAHTHQLADLPPYPDPGDPVPTGAVMPFAGILAPDGWLLCDGAPVSRTTYATLFGVISTNYGAGDTVTTFNVPNLKGRIPVGLDTGDSAFDELGPNPTAYIGAKSHTLTIAQMPSHTHNITDLASGDNFASTTYAWARQGGTYTPKVSGASGGGQAHNNMPPYLVMNYIIRT